MPCIKRISQPLIIYLEISVAFMFLESFHRILNLFLNFPLVILTIIRVPTLLDGIKVVLIVVNQVNASDEKNLHKNIKRFILSFKTRNPNRHLHKTTRILCLPN